MCVCACVSICVSVCVYLCHCMSVCFIGKRGVVMVIELFIMDIKKSFDLPSINWTTKATWCMIHSECKDLRIEYKEHPCLRKDWMMSLLSRECCYPLSTLPCSVRDLRSLVGSAHCGRLNISNVFYQCTLFFSENTFKAYLRIFLSFIWPSISHIKPRTFRSSKFFQQYTIKNQQLLGTERN